MLHKNQNTTNNFFFEERPLNFRSGPSSTPSGESDKPKRKLAMLSPMNLGDRLNSLSKLKRNMAKPSKKPVEPKKALEKTKAEPSKSNDTQKKMEALKLELDNLLMGKEPGQKVDTTPVAPKKAKTDKPSDNMVTVVESPIIVREYDDKYLSSLNVTELLGVTDEIMEKHNKNTMLRDGKALIEAYNDMMFDMQTSNKDSNTVVKNWIQTYFTENLDIK